MASTVRSSGGATGQRWARAWSRTSFPVPEQPLTGGVGLDLINLGGTLYFSYLGFPNPQNQGLYRSDGTDAGTTLVKKIIGVRALTNFNGTLYFGGAGDDPTFKIGLWRSDGTTAGTTNVKEGVAPSEIVNADGTMYIDDGYRDLWRSDGTEAGYGDGQGHHSRRRHSGPHGRRRRRVLPGVVGLLQQPRRAVAKRRDRGGDHHRQVPRRRARVRLRSHRLQGQALLHRRGLAVAKQRHSARNDHRQGQLQAESGSTHEMFQRPDGDGG